MIIVNKELLELASERGVLEPMQAFIDKFVLAVPFFTKEQEQYLNEWLLAGLKLQTELLPYYLFEPECSVRQMDNFDN